MALVPPLLLFCQVSLVSCCSMYRFIQEEGLALENHIISTIFTVDVSMCRLQCVQTPLCFSVNVQTVHTGMVACELNNSSKSADPQDIRARVGSEYQQMAELDHCMMDHCLYKEALPDGWYRYGSKLLKFFPTRKTWGQAQQFCQSLGGELVTINDERENEFVVELSVNIATNMTGPLYPEVIAHWKLDGSDVDITLVDGATYAEDNGTDALFLGGSGAHATTPAVNFRFTNFTISSWVKVLSSLTQSVIYADWSPPLQFLFARTLSGSLRVGVVDNRGSYAPWFEGGSTPIGTWFHAAVVWDRDANHVYLFVDGQKVGTEVLEAGTYMQDTSHSLYDIGLKRDDGSTLHGYLRDLMIVGKSLTAEEMLGSEDLSYKPGGVWTSLNDVSTEGIFHWTDGSHVKYTNWASGQQDNQYNYQNCVAIKINDGIDRGKWEDISCGQSLPFVCSRSP